MSPEINNQQPTSNNQSKFSVLISVYHKEQPEYFNRSLESLQNQTLQADEIVIVEDGPLTDELYAVLENWGRKLPLKRVDLEENVGLGQALAGGLGRCTHGIVARMDADDICLPERFAKQISFLNTHPEVDIVGTSISEFEGAESNIYSWRELPESHDQIIQYAKRRNPFNHMTVMFKKEVILAAGSYQPCQNFEDYDLWVRLFQTGGIGANICESLVNARAGKDMLKRRHGWNYALTEVKFWQRVYKSRFITFVGFATMLVIRCPLRILPYSVLKVLYNNILRK